MKKSLVILAALGFFCVVKAVSAEEAYYTRSLTSVPLTSGTLPQMGSSTWQHLRLASVMRSYVVLDGPGEAYISCAPASAGRNFPTSQPFCGQGDWLTLKAPAGKSVAGSIYVAEPDFKGMRKVTFRIPAQDLASGAKTAFLRGKLAYYRNLQSLGAAGTAWYRHVAEKTAREVEPQLKSGEQAINNQAAFGRPSTDSLEDSFEFFSGGQALSENLQLDRGLVLTTTAAEKVELATLEGITVSSIDWKPLINGRSPQRDSLSAIVPADHYVLFSPTFDSFLRIVDEAQSHSEALLPHLDSRAEDYHVERRYQKQLCLNRSELGELFGRMVIGSVAVIGSDPYLRSGSTIALAFETKNPHALQQYIEANYAAALAQNVAVKKVDGEFAGVHYSGVSAPDRTVSSYLISLPQGVVITNSLSEVEAIIQTSLGKAPSIASLDEYTYFRTIYPQAAGQESALLLVTDAAIRKWGSARWRILDSRRTRAAALLSEQVAQQIDSLAAGSEKNTSIKKEALPLELGEVVVGADGVRSSLYGTLGFLTPIAELPLSKVSEAEAAAYTRFRNAYQNNWRQYFDPIAIRFEVTPHRIKADLSVLPLIIGSEYHELISLSQGELLKQSSGDPHASSIFHLILAFNGKSPFVQSTGGFVSGMTQGITDPLGWLGNSGAIYLDSAPIWEELKQSKEHDKFLEEHYQMLPVALRLEVKDSLKLTMVLSALRAFANESAPGLTTWETRTYLEQPYVRVASQPSPSQPPNSPSPAVFYVATPGALTVSLNEVMIKNAIERMKGRPNSGITTMPWAQDSNVAVAVNKQALDIFKNMGSEYQGESVRSQAWSNIYILNELKRLFPEKDPQALYETLWHTSLSSPQTGDYVWNTEWQTMESTLFGHPGQPKAVQQRFGVVDNITSGNVALSFENNGLRVKAEYER